MFEPLDLAASDEDILEATKALAESGRNFQPADLWRAAIAVKMNQRAA